MKPGDEVVFPYKGEPMLGNIEEMSHREPGLILYVISSPPYLYEMEDRYIYSFPQLFGIKNKI